jgi:hypothetical protein
VLQLLNTRNALLARIMDHYRTIHNLKGEVSEAENQLKGVKEARGKQTELNGKAVDFYQYILKTYKELQAYKEVSYISSEGAI